jgi:hypothetical protein
MFFSLLKGKGEMMTYWLVGEEAWRTRRVRRLSTVEGDAPPSTLQTTVDAHQSTGHEVPLYLSDKVHALSELNPIDASLTMSNQELNNDVHISVDGRH